MNDMKGRELKVGQKVLRCYIGKSGASMEEVYVRGFSKKRVRLGICKSESKYGITSCGPSRLYILEDV